VNNPEIGYHTHFARSWFQWLSELEKNIPEIENMARISYHPGSIVSKAEDSFKTAIYYSDPSFFEMFSVDFIQPPAGVPLSEPYTLILTTSLSQKLFPGENPVGKSLEVYCTNCQAKKEYRVTGVIKDCPANSHFNYEIIAAYEDPEDIGWGYYYLLLGPNSRPGEVVDKFPSFAADYADEETIKTLIPHLQNIRDIHLKSHKDRELEENGNLKNIRFFSFLSFTVLFLSLFNFINLQYVGLIYRYPSLEILKVLGANGKSLALFQFLEVLIISILSAIMSLAMVGLLHPFLSQLIHSDFPALLSSGNVFLSLLGLIILMALSVIAGIYPFFLVNLRTFFSRKRDRTSSRSGVSAMIGKAKLRLAKFLIVFQYAATLIVLLLMYYSDRQVEFMMNKRMGGQQNIMVLKDIPVQVINKYEVFRDQLLKSPLIYDVTSSFEDPADENMDAMPFQTEGIASDKKEKRLYVYPADDNFFRFYEQKIIAGIDFPQNYGNDSIQENYILNESAVNYLGWEPGEAVGKSFSLVFQMNGKNLFNGGRIIGVVEDFQPSSMKNEIKPYVFFQKSFWLFSIQIKYDESRTAEVLAHARKKWNEIYEGYPFYYTFIEELYSDVYKNEIRLRNLGKAIGLIAILLSGLGLWALTGILYQKRTKEIGIRRVNGARAIQILWLLFREIIFLTSLAIVPGVIVSYYIIDAWLRNFPYHVDISVVVFLLIALSILLLSILTISYHAIKASYQNPVKSLRDE
jgi:putative ABC transport system permease protein